MLTMQISVQQGLDSAAAWERVLPRFQHEAGKLLVEAVRDVLGSAEIYTLSPEWSRKKQRLRRFRRVSGKPADQPLILTREVYGAVRARYDGNAVIVEVNPGRAVEDGFDYAAHWDEVTDFLGKGFEIVEDQLPDLLVSIIFEEIRL